MTSVSFRKCTQFDAGACRPPAGSGRRMRGVGLVLGVALTAAGLVAAAPPVAAATGVTAPLVPVGGGIDCFGTPYGGPAGPAGTVSVQLSDAGIAVTVDASGVEAGTYSIEVFEATADCGSDDAAATGASVTAGTSATVLLAPLPYATIGGASLGDGAGTEQVVIVLDDQASACGCGDRYVAVVALQQEELRIGVIADGARGVITGTATGNCVGRIEVASAAGTALWGELRTTWSGASAPPNPADSVAGVGLLAPDGYLPAHWNACFTAANQAFSVTVDTTTARAEFAQLAEILVAFTGESLYTTISDLSLLPGLLANLPPRFASTAGLCLGIAPCVAAALVTSLLTEPVAWQRWASIAQRLSSVRQILELVDLLQRLGEQLGRSSPLFLVVADLLQQIASGLVQGESPRVIEARVERTLADAQRSLDQALADVDRAQRSQRRAVADLTRATDDLQALRNDKVALERQLQDVNFLIADCTGCSRTELRQLFNRANAISDDLVRNAKRTTQLVSDLPKLQRLVDEAASLVASVEAVARTARTFLDAISDLLRLLPLIEVLIQTTITMAAKIAAARSNANQGTVFFVSCARSDQRPACRAAWG